MGDKEWLSECARHAAQSATDRGGAPLAWLAEAAEKERQARAEFGDAAFDEALARWRDHYEARNGIARTLE